MKVRCIDDLGRTEFIAKGEVYEVAKEGKTSYWLVGDNPTVSHIKSRFVVVEEDAGRTSTHSSTPQAKRDDMAFFKSVREGYCACNIPKATCNYHSGA